ncbi:hypothetical protein C8R44DRAFT_774657 [Mycena epipterygia]|nr:hypothetical protein C8R44DRAFT_774657 [Mycena epipterygia]
MLEAQLKAAKEDAEAANAHAVLMARENLKINNQLNAKKGKGKENRGHFQAGGRCMTMGEALEHKRQEAEDERKKKEEAERKRQQREEDKERRQREKDQRAKEVRERKALRELMRLTKEDAKKKRQQLGSRGRGRGRGGASGRGRGGASRGGRGGTVANGRSHVVESDAESGSGSNHDSESEAELGDDDSSSDSANEEQGEERVDDAAQPLRRSSRTRPDRPWAQALADIDAIP